MRLTLVTLALVAAPSALAIAQASKRPMEVDDRFRFVEVGLPVISPDGRWVLYTRTRLTLRDNQRHTTTWLASVAAEAPSREFLHEGDRALTWAPNSHTVFFFRHAGNGDHTSDELFQQAVDDSVAEQRSHLQSDLGYNWQLARDGTFFLLARAESLPQGPGADVDAVFVDEGSNGQTRDFWSNLWRYDLGTGTLTRLTNRDWVINVGSPGTELEFAL